MRILGKMLTVVLLLFLSNAPSMADLICAKIRSDNRDIILFSEFQYSHTGYVSVAVSSVGMSSTPVTSDSSQPDLSGIGFFLLPNDLVGRYDLELNEKPDLCASDIKFVKLLFTFQNLSSHPHSSLNESYHVTSPGLYSLYFANCNNVSLSMDVRAELYNDDGTTKDYISAAQPQPSLYFKFFLVYLCFLGFWIILIFKHQQFVQMIHLVMGVLLVLTLLYFICGVADQHDVKVTGTHNGWHVMFYIFQFIRNVLFFPVILLIGTGWCFFKRSLSGRETFVLTIVILLQVWANISSIMLQEFGPYSVHWPALNGMFKFADAVCGLLVLTETFVSIMSFSEVKDTKSFLRSFSSLEKTSARPLVFVLLVLVYLMIASSPHKLLNVPWKFTLAQEVYCLVFSMVMFYMYRPSVLDYNIDEKYAGLLV